MPDTATEHRYAEITRDRQSRWIVTYKGVEYARFRPSEEDNAIDFANGFNAGLNEGRRASSE